MQDRTALKFAASVRMANIKNKTKQKTNKGLRDGSMVKVVKALAALAEDRGLDISIYMAVSNLLLRSGALFQPPRVLHAQGTLGYMQANTPT